MNKYWARWTQTTEDYRPLIDEFEYWCSGYDRNDLPILCCLIEAESEAKAIELISHGWPEEERDDFTIEEQPPDWEPSDRFPRKHKRGKSLTNQKQFEKDCRQPGDMLLRVDSTTRTFCSPPLEAKPEGVDDLPLMYFDTADKTGRSRYRIFFAIEEI